MKKWIAALLAAVLLMGCASQPGQPESTENIPEPTPEQTVLPETCPVTTAPGEGEIPFSDPGEVRIDYTEQEQYVRYITCVEQLPEEAKLSGYDEQFFREHALVLVKLNLTSGSIQPELERIHLADGRAVVSVRRKIPGGEMTDDMASWLLWATVERNLACQWTLAEDTDVPRGEKY